MVNNISLDYVENAFIELEDFFWVKEPINWKNILKLIRKKKISSAIELIWKQLWLNIKINLIYVKNKDFTTSNLTQSKKNCNSSISAQVLIPSNLPRYWTKELDNFSIDVKIHKSIIKNPLTFIVIMSHELSHILLYSLRHRQKENEIYTDITAIILGFLNIYSRWRKFEKYYSSFWLGVLWINLKRNTITTTFGYLSDYNFVYIKTQINKRMNIYYNKVKKSNKLLDNYIIKVGEIKYRYLYLKQILNFLIKNPLKEMWLNDFRIMSWFLQNWYIENLDNNIKYLDKKINIFSNDINNNSFYLKQNLNNLTSIENSIKGDLKNINLSFITINKDIIFLESNINFLRKIFFILINSFKKYAKI